MNHVRRQARQQLVANAGTAKTASIVSPPPAQTSKKLAQFREFCDYITDTEPKRHLAGSLQTWDRNHAWCWDTRPVCEPTREVYDHVFIDGTYIAHGWCVLIAATTDGVIDYQLCNQESKAAYTSLLKHIPAPQVVTTDGQRGALAAIKECWPTTRIQCCLVHVQRNIRRITTSRPRIKQHKALYKLALDLTNITTTHPLSATTNPLEGGINAPLKAFLHAHRGWFEHHILTALDYWLYARSIDRQPLETFITNTRQARPTSKHKPNSDQPAEIDNHIDHEQPWEDSLTIRKGWIRN